MVSLSLLLVLAPLISATCYHRDGSTTSADWTECPNSNICCPTGDTCMDNGLCRDKNNHANGSLTDISGSEYNYTGLYYTSACQSTDFNDYCYTSCTTSSSDSSEYVWVCNSAMTSYCCHQDSASLAQFDCCSNNTFVLASPIPLSEKSSSSTTSSSATATSTLSTSSTTSISTSTSTPSSASSTTSPLSSGAKAGIGIGAAAAGIIILVLVAMLMRARRNIARQNQLTVEKTPQQGQKEESAKPHLVQEYPSEMPVEYSSTTAPPPGELPAREPAAGELRGSGRLYELGPR